ncbi:MAG: hypothetical protein C4320_08995, partial [Armatimonadota bacterium]
MSGAGKLTVREKKRPDFRATVTARAGGLRFRKERVETATYQGVITDRQASGVLRISNETDRIGFEGVVDYATPAVRAQGLLDASLATARRIRPYLPKGTDLEWTAGRFDGFVAYDQDGGRAQGILRAATLRTPTLSARNLSARVALKANELTLRLERGEVANTPLTGAATINLRTRQLVGFAQAPQARGEDFSAFFRLPKGLQVGGAGAVAFNGPVQNPRLLGTGLLRGTFRLPNGKLLPFTAPVSLAGNLSGGTFPRVELRTPAGTLTAQGSFGRGTGWNLAVSGRNLILA